MRYRNSKYAGEILFVCSCFDSDSLKVLIEKDWNNNKMTAQIDNIAKANCIIGVMTT